MMKKVLQQEGSRDVSAQLFVTLARACGLGVRLVASLQAVPWRAEKVVAKKKPGAGRGGRTLASRQGNGPASEEEESDEDEMEQVLIPGSGVEDVVPPEVTEKLPTTQGRVRAAGKRRLQDPADLYRLRKAKPTPQKVGTSMKPNAKSKQGALITPKKGRYLNISRSIAIPARILGRGFQPFRSTLDPCRSHSGDDPKEGSL